MTLRVDVLSIGTLSRNLLWGERTASRTPHATTTLIRQRDDKTGAGETVLVDPGLPAAAIVARLFERTGLTPDRIDTIFLTCFKPAHRAGLEAFAGARVLIHEPERDAVLAHLQSLLERLDEAGRDEEDDESTRQMLTRELRLLESLRVAPDSLLPNVDLFPLPGATPGTCGLLVNDPVNTTLIAGDAVATRDHLLAGQVLPDPFNLSTAQESLREAYEIADVIIPGHDNAFASPRSFGSDRY